MYERLLKSIAEKVPSTEEELHICTRYFTPKKLRKRQYLLQEGDVSNRLAFVEEGALYSYTIDTKGVQRVQQFAFEGWWIADLYSFFTKEPSKLSIEALEESELLLLDHEQHQKLLQNVPKYETYTRILYQNAYVALQQRLEGTLGLPAEEKYLRLIEQYPSILNRVPLHLIASYLGVTPETLSRIRKQMIR
ncbi:MAG: Crp/Fnr family transcriptional regulator [Bacteroidota bacterium]|nr:Crp/Fnr family transcriptional regulator [Flavisolibacter sp.]MBD0287909.1 Crp/Fnr family transcriptional regulator [Flavisolibacter sp.]MBD0351161.1 Crp/Fnr family transcriptional regulator [Flavisolibacter sp.]MDQ3843620.1 Crp/Fnr family transcriptional regulator [Bacteroidota bacterium]